MPLKLEKYLTCSLMLHCLRAILFELVVLLDIILSWNLIYKIGLVSYLHYILYGRTEAYSEPPLMAAGEKGQIPLLLLICVGVSSSSQSCSGWARYSSADFLRRPRAFTKLPL